VIDKPIILAIVPNLMISTRIESNVEQLEFDYREISSFEDDMDLAKQGSRKAFLERISGWDLALIIIDLGNNQIPWEQWILSLKSSSSTQKIPILCFGPHVDVDTLQTARDAGADAVMARSRFISAMPSLIKKYMIQPNSPSDKINGE